MGSSCGRAWCTACACDCGPRSGSDVTEEDQIAAAVRTAHDRSGGIDVLVNKAGNGYLSAIEEGEDDQVQVRTLFDTNYFGVVDDIKAVLPAMRARRSRR